MHFDALTLACLRDELDRCVCGGRVQEIMLVDEETLGLEFYAQRQRTYLLLSAVSANPRLYLVGRKLRRGPLQPTPLLLLLRKYVRGSRLAAVVQPDPFERVLRLRFEHAEHGVSTLVAEPIGRNANLLLLGPDERILDCLHRSRPPERGGRTLLPGAVYAPPPALAKLPPLDDGRPDYYDRLAAVVEEDGPLWQALVARLAGLSPTLARETAWRAGGAVDAPARGVALLALIQALQTLWAPLKTGEWQPGVWQTDAGAAGFSPYPAHIRGEFVPTASLSEAIEAFDAAREQGGVDAYAAQRSAVAALLRGARKRIEGSLEALRGDEAAPGEIEQLRLQAGWLLALAETVPPGAATLDVPLDGEVLSIPLEAGRSPVEQAQRMFKRAGKLERAAGQIAIRRTKLQIDREFLTELAADLAAAENAAEIAAVREELAAMGILRQAAKSSREAKTGGGEGALRRFVSAAGFEILAGRNARQNEHVTFRVGRGDDLWLHARGVPGAHVVVRRRGAEVDEETLRAAAQLAAVYSGLRGERSAAVVVTEVRFVSRLPGGHTGQVTLRNERTLFVAAELPKSVDRK